MDDRARERRFIIRRTWVLWPLFLLIGFVRDSNSYVAIEGDYLRVRFGAWFNERFPLSVVEGAEAGHWPWIGGLGWRMDFRGRVALVGSHSGIIDIDFRESQRVPLLPFIKVGCRRLTVSLKEPEDFLAALRRAIR